MLSRPRWAAGLAGLLLLAPPLAAQQAAPQPDTLPRRLRPAGHTLPIQIGGLCAIGLPPDMALAGGQRFILKGIADAEQLLFVAADSRQLIQRLYWVQAEYLLPARPGRYDYGADSNRTLGGLPWAVSVRRLGAEPAAGSDRSAVDAFLTAQGYHFPRLGPRLRLVHVAPDARSELMIIYQEAEPQHAMDTLFASVLARGTQGLTITACH